MICLFSISDFGCCWSKMDKYMVWRLYICCCCCFLVIGALTLRRIRTQIEIKWLVKANICCCYSCCRSCGLAGNSKMKNNYWLLCINLFRWKLQWVTNAPDKPTGLLDIVEWSSMWMKARRRLLLLLLPLLLILFNVFFFSF